MTRNWGWMLAGISAGTAAGCALTKRLWLSKYREQSAKLSNLQTERDLLYMWLLLEQKGIQIEEYFSAHRHRTIAVLGMGWAGRRLIDELLGTPEITVAYGVEGGAFSAVHEALEVYRLGEDTLPAADCLVICGLKQRAEEASAARKEFSGEVVALDRILAWLLEKHKIKWTPWLFV